MNINTFGMIGVCIAITALTVYRIIDLIKFLKDEDKYEKEEWRNK